MQGIFLALQNLTTRSRLLLDTTQMPMSLSAIMESQFSPQRLAEHLQVLHRRNIDGVVLFNFTGMTETLLSPWQSCLVLLARAASGFASVSYDDEGAILLLMEKLYALGHRHISYIGVPQSDITTGLRRHTAYLAFCKQHHLSPLSVLPGLAMKNGYEHAADVLTPQTTALVCATDPLALGASKYLQKQRIDSLQLASVGNTPLLKFLHPEIISADPGCAHAGRQAATQLIDLLNDRAALHSTVIPARLV